MQRANADQLARAVEERITRGLALQRASFARDDVVTVFGASEIALPAPFRATEFFASAPTGFTVFAVGEPGTPLLMTVQNLAALGERLRGRRVAILLTPDYFTYPASTKRPDPEKAVEYRKYYAPLQTAATIFSPDLAAGTKRAIAWELLAAPSVIEGSPLLSMALRLLANPTPSNRVAYAAIYPLGRAMVRSLEALDHMVILGKWLRARATAPIVVKQAAAPDWTVLRAEADSMAQSRSTTNPYGYQDDIFARAAKPRLAELRGSRPDSAVLAGLSSAAGFASLDLMMSIFAQYGARPMFILAPFKGPWADFMGTSKQTRRQVYATAEAFARRRQVLLVTFDAYDDDRWFLVDRSHPGGKAWVVFDELLDKFYHGKLD